MTQPAMDRKMGELVHTTFDLRVEASTADDGDHTPGLAWTLSEETLDTLREIDASIRAAEQMSGNLLIG